jgi:hypothetical protein
VIASSIPTYTSAVEFVLDYWQALASELGFDRFLNNSRSARLYSFGLCTRNTRLFKRWHREVRVRSLLEAEIESAASPLFWALYYVAPGCAESVGILRIEFDPFKLTVDPWLYLITLGVVRSSLNYSKKISLIAHIARLISIVF